MVNSFVQIIESPSDLDLLDGRTEGRCLWEALQIAGIFREYTLVTTRRTLVKSISERLWEAASRMRRWPILHISMHGNSDGVALTDGTFIYWDELRQLLAPVTNYMNGGLLVCMSSCFGSAGCRMAMHEGTDQPFWALVGNDTTIEWGDAAVGYVTLYHLFFKGFDLDSCVTAMQKASGSPHFRLNYGHLTKQNWHVVMSSQRLEQFLSSLGHSGHGDHASVT